LLRGIGVRHGYSPAEVAVAWVLRHPAVTGAIVGARKQGQFKGVAGASRLQLCPREIDEIDGFVSKSAA
jgi:aryl-alcohol dehydrogenase-like predicted oxidoreductase